VARENYDLTAISSNRIQKTQRALWNISKGKSDVFIDNHVSDGADYQYTLTYIMNSTINSAMFWENT